VSAEVAPASATDPVVPDALVPARRNITRADRLTGGAVEHCFAAEAVYDELAPAVLGYFRSSGVRDAEDLTGDVFVAVTRDLHKFLGDEAAMRRWVFTIAHHRMVDHFRRSARRNQRAASQIPDVPARDAPDTFDSELARALRALPEPQRQAVVLRFVADIPTRDVASITGKSVGAIKMLQTRGLANLKAALRSPP
jgi:RNA polymerase sigma-70 factor (ECF subfamily)